MKYEILQGDCREMMRTMPEKSVQTCVTSPPYFGLRDYGNDGQIGLEPTPDEFVGKLVEVFREVRRVLRDDGTIWLNLGDSYSGGGGFSPNSPSNQAGSKQTSHKGSIRGAIGVPNGLKPKDLIGIPWRVAFALQQDGWYLRQDIIWHKPNPMPESVTDRCTKAHEYIFLLSKSPSYYFDHMAIAEPAIYAEQHAKKTTSWGHKKEKAGVKGNIEQYRQVGIENNKTCLDGGMKNKRSVWTVTTKPFSGAHFATFPPDLIEPCILAGSAVGDTVLDPFGGSGTTALVANQLGRNAILCELNAEYISIAHDRIKTGTAQQDLFMQDAG